MSEKEKLYEQNKGTGILYHVFDDGCNCMGCTGAGHRPDGMLRCCRKGHHLPIPRTTAVWSGCQLHHQSDVLHQTRQQREPLPDSAAAWSMVKDNVTGLIWEMKTNKDGFENYNDPHDADNTYTWYDSNPATNGGNAGGWGDGKNTENFIKALNDARYGGFRDWRMPTLKELTYIVNCSIPYPGPTITTDYFPNTVSFFYWSSTAGADDTNYAWGVPFYYGNVNLKDKGYSYYVRAVRGGQSGAMGDLVIGSFDSWGGASIENADILDNYTDNSDGTVTDTSTGLISY